MLKGVTQNLLNSPSQKHSIGRNTKVSFPIHREVGVVVALILWTTLLFHFLRGFIVLNSKIYEEVKPFLRGSQNMKDADLFHSMRIKKAVN